MGDDYAMGIYDDIFSYIQLISIGYITNNMII